MTSGPLAAYALAATFLGGCASLPPDTARDDVQRDIDARFGAAMPLTPRGDERSAWRSALEDGVLEADEAVRLAVANNPMLQSVLLDLDIARAELWKAALPPNPVVDGELLLVESGGGEIIELAVAQSIIDVILIPRRRQVAGERFEQARAEVTAAVIDLATEVRAAYRNLQAELQAVELLRSAADAAYFSFDAARRLRDAGNVIELEVLQQQALYEDAKIELVDAEARALGHRENLNSLLGVWGPDGETWTVEPRMPVPTALDVTGEDLESRVVEASLDLRASRHGILALGHAVGLRRLEVTFPELTLGAKAEREADGTWSGGPVTSFSLPVFDYGQAAGAEARARLEQAYGRHTDLAIRIRRAARTAYLESEAAANSSRYLIEVVLPLRTRITEQTHRQLNAMQLGVFQLLEARRSELDAGRRYVETLRDHWIARARVEALLLGRLPARRFGLTDMKDEASAEMAHETNVEDHR